MEHYVNTRAERTAREAISFLAYGVILIALAYVSAHLWLTLLCAALSVLAAIRAIRLFGSAMSFRDQLIEEEFVFRIDRPRN